MFSSQTTVLSPFILKWENGKQVPLEGFGGLVHQQNVSKNNLESVLDESGPSYQANTARDKMMKCIEIDPQHRWFVGLRVLRITPSLVCIHIGPHNPQPWRWQQNFTSCVLS